MYDKEFEAWFDENFPTVTYPMTRGIARAAWDGRWELLVKQYSEQKNEGNH